MNPHSVNPLRDPVWRGSLMVLVRHYPAYALAILVGCAALALSALSGRSFVDAAEVALIQGQADAVPPDARADEQARVRASVFDAQRPRVEALVADGMAHLNGATTPQEIRRPVRYRDSDLVPTPQAVNAAGAGAVAVLFEAGGALESLVPEAGTAGTPGVWIPDTLADELGLAPGDPFGVALTPPGADRTPAPATVAGVYRTDADGVPEDPTGLWRRLGPDLPPWPSHLTPTATQLPLLVADTATYRTLIAAIDERSLATWDVEPAGDPVRLDDVARLVASEQTLSTELEERRDRTDITLATGLPDQLAAARVGYSATIQGVSAVRVVGMGLSWLVVALAGVALLIRRRGERQLLVDAGRSPLELAALTMVEALLPIGLGLLAGLYAARPLVAYVVGTPGTPVRPQDTAVVAAVSVATLVVASYADAVRRHRLPGTRAATTRRLPWRTVVVTLAGAGAVSAYAGSKDFDTTTALFPLAAVAAVGVLASSGLAAGLARLARRWQPRRLAARLTFARLARDRGSSTAFLAATVAFGAVAYGLLFQVSADRAADDKVAAAVGAESTYEVSRAITPQVDDDATLVRTTTVPGGSGGRVRLFLLDPATFARAALWSPRFGDLDDLLGALSADDASIPVAQVGAPRDPPVGTTVVARLATFPGTGDYDTVFVADWDRFDTTPAEDVTTLLWSSRGAQRADGLKLEATAAQVRADPALVARTWVTEYLQAFTLLALGLGLLVLVGLHRRDREQRRLLDVTLADLGRPPRLATRAAGRELAIVAALGALAGGLAAYAVTWSLRGPLDPLPDLRPALAVTGTTQLALAGGAFVAAAIAVTLLAGRLGRARSVNELLHDE